MPKTLIEPFRIKSIEPIRMTTRAERERLLAGLEAERREVFQLARHRQISDEVARKLVREIDLLEARYAV